MSVHLFYNPLYLNNNIFVIFNNYFIFLFCLYLFIFSFVLIFFSLSLSHLSYQYLSFFYFFLLLFMENSSSFLSRSRSNHLPPQVSSSSFSFHGQIIYPPQAPISTTRTTRIKTHKHGLRRPTSTNPQALKPILVNPQVQISTADTDPQASRPIFIDPRTLI